MPNIKTFCRIKPTKDVYPDHELKWNKTLLLNVPEVLRDYNTPSKGGRAFINHEFNFNHIFEQDATQEQVFEVAACNIVQAFLTGYNGTIFAYGQTGTGKTYTVEGSAKTYEQRGLEPRALSLIYQELEKRSDEDISIHISYLEIYQEVGYDLLNPGARTQSFVTPFPKVSVLEGHNGMCVIRNLSNHLAASEEVAQSLLLQGQANRKVAATAVHDRSSRSHAVFTIQLTAKKPDSNTLTRSKLHLVDLAGSERVAKTGVHGAQLTEAKSINLSLHHLESVIVALQSESLSNVKRIRTSEGGRKYQLPVRPSTADSVRVSRHVPYRNSLLTMVLRDSLGGNCMTAMIATISLEFINIGETISTCRFAGRVACIANAVSRNEELDEKSLIKKLRKRINELEAEIACLRTEQGGDTGRMSTTMAEEEEDCTVCVKVIQQYLSGRISDPVSAGITNPYRFRECLKILKGLIVKNKFGPLPAEIDSSSRSLTSLTVSIPSHVPDNTSTSQFDPDETDQQVFEDSGKVQILKVHESKKENESRKEKSMPVKPDTPVTTNPPSDQPMKKPTPAWGEESQASQERAVTPALTEDKKAWKEIRDPETLSQMLNIGSKQKVKAPFEQKREREIKKLNAKVERLEADRLDKEHQVTNIKLMVAEQELDLMERHMRTKLGVTNAQVEDQKAYIEQLRSTEADNALIEQEKLVEQQLKKRQAKFDKQLEYIENRRRQLRNHADTDLTMEKKASLQDKYGQFRQHDGSLNTRQVYQMLRSEERKQTKARNQVEKEKVIATSNLMEVREMATRQRLRELKEMMKSGNMYVPHENNVGALDTSHVNGHSEQDISQINGHAEVSEMNGHTNVTSPDQRASSKKGNSYTPGAKRTASRVGSQPSVKSDVLVIEDAVDQDELQSVSTSRPGSSLSAQSNTSRLPDANFYAKRKKEKDPTSKWESSYSRPTTPSSLHMDDSALGNVYIPKVKNGVLLNRQGEKEEEKSVRKSAVDTQEAIVTQPWRPEQASSPAPKTAEKQAKTAEIKYSHEESAVSYDKKQEDKSKTREHLEQKSQPKSKPVVNNKDLTSDIIETESRKLEEELLNSRNRVSKHRPASESRKPHHTFMPSEYIYKMADGDGFDARKMGLSSKNFDTALSSMLDKENADLVVKHADYDQFARTAPYQVSPYIQAASIPPPHHRQKQRSTVQRSKSQRSSEDKSTRSEAKDSLDHSSSGISAKITRYLQQTPSKERKQQHKSSSAGAERTSYDITDVSKYRQQSSASLLEPKPSLEIEEEQSGKVTALREQEREATYMNKAQSQKDRVKKIRMAQQSAQRIQRAWRRYKLKLQQSKTAPKHRWY